MMPPLAIVDVGTLLEGTSGFLAYPLVFLLAMVPLIEPFVVIPVAIGLGFDPVLTGIAAFAGSVTVVLAIVLTHHRLRRWWTDRSAASGRAASANGPAEDGGRDDSAGDGDRDDSAGDDAAEAGSNGRYDRAKRVGERYGLVGLALAGPPLAGLHLMAIVGAAIGPDDRTTLGWLTGGLAAWTIALVVGSVAGLSAVESLLAR